MDKVTSIKRRTAKEGYLFVLPAFLIIFIFLIYPLFHSLYLSLTDFDYVYPDACKFIGLKNYFHLFKDETFIIALKHTGILLAVYYPLVNILSLSIALLISGKFKGMKVIRACIFVPIVIPLSFVAIIWQWMYSYSYGVINQSISNVFHLSALQRNWLGDPNYALYSIIIVTIWVRIGFDSLIFLAGLHGIPKDLYEAAEIDGAGSPQRLRHITLPLLKESFILVGVLEAIFSIKTFTQIYVMTGGGPAESTEVLYTYAYKSAFRYYKMGYAGAISYVMTAVILFVAWANMKVFRTERK